MNAILLDIEGTTTPIDFVHKTLFPYAKERIGKFVETHFSNLHREIDQLVEESSKDETYTLPVDPTEPGSVSAYLEYLIDNDRKSTPLKSIQGKIWRDGYESGELRSVVFDDIPAAFERWTNDGLSIAIFSSGSTLAQKLLFTYTTQGDLSKYISYYFDTNIGSKLSGESYRLIASEMALDPADILFVSDVLAELAAASTAGYQAALSVRRGNAPIEEDFSYQAIESFDELA
jgi:enolase-phosphatase E1